jgi:hypothetical protein
MFLIVQATASKLVYNPLRDKYGDSGHPDVTPDLAFQDRVFKSVGRAKNSKIMESLARQKIFGYHFAYDPGHAPGAAWAEDTTSFKPTYGMIQE